MSGSSDLNKAIFERLVEKTRRKAEARGETIEKRKPKSPAPKKGKKCSKTPLLN